MAEKEIQDWIKEAKKRGVSKSEVESELKKHGYNSSLVSKTSNTKTWKYIITAIIIFGVLASLFGIYSLVFKPLVFKPNAFTEELKQAESLFKSEKWDEAIGPYQKILAGNPDLNAEYTSNKNIGTCYLKKKAYNKAISHYKKAIKLKPDEAYIANKNLGVIYYRRKDYDTSFEYLIRALTLANNPLIHSTRLDELYFHLGSVYSQKKEFDKSTEYHRKVIEVPESDASPYYLGYSYYLLGVYDKAEFYLNKYLKDYPGGGGESEVKSMLNTIKESKKS